MKPKRYTIMPHIPNPYGLRYWLANNGTYRHVVPHTIVTLSHYFPSKWTYELVRPLMYSGATRMVYAFQSLLHGDSIQQSFAMMQPDDTVLMMEEDCYVTNPDKLEQTFQDIENGKYDISCVPRCAMGEELIEASKDWFKIGHESGAWPAGFVCKARTLQECPTTFNNRNYVKGDVIDWLGGYKVQSESTSSDTMTEVAWWLRFNGYKFHHRPDDKIHAGPFLKGPKPYPYISDWSVHIGSLSSSMSGAILDDRNVPLSYSEMSNVGIDLDNPHWYSDDIMEKAKRCAMWKLWHDASDRTGLEDLSELYTKGLERFVDLKSVNQSDIDHFYEYFKNTIPLQNGFVA